MGGMIMTDFKILRKRYSDVLCGSGYNGKKTADCILQSDERTEQRLVQLGGRIEKAITSNEPGVINATLKGILDVYKRQLSWHCFFASIGLWIMLWQVKLLTAYFTIYMTFVPKNMVGFNKFNRTA